MPKGRRIGAQDLVVTVVDGILVLDDRKVRVDDLDGAGIDSGEDSIAEPNVALVANEAICRKAEGSRIRLGQLDNNEFFVVVDFVVNAVLVAGVDLGQRLETRRV